MAAPITVYTDPVTQAVVRATSDNQITFYNNVVSLVALMNTINATPGWNRRAVLEFDVVRPSSTSIKGYEVDDKRMGDIIPLLP